MVGFLDGVDLTSLDSFTRCLRRAAEHSAEVAAKAAKRADEALDYRGRVRRSLGPGKREAIVLILKLGVFVTTALSYSVFFIWTATRPVPFETQAGMVALAVAGTMTVNLIQVDRGWSMEPARRWMQSRRRSIRLLGLLVITVGVWGFKPHSMDYWARSSAVALTALAALRILPQGHTYSWLTESLSWVLIVGLVLYSGVWFSQLFQDIRYDLQGQRKKTRRWRR